MLMLIGAGFLSVEIKAFAVNNARVHSTYIHTYIYWTQNEHNKLTEELKACMIPI